MCKPSANLCRSVNELADSCIWNVILSKIRTYNMYTVTYVINIK